MAQPPILFLQCFVAVSVPMFDSNHIPDSNYLHSLAAECGWQLISASKEFWDFLSLRTVVCDGLWRIYVKYNV